MSHPGPVPVDRSPCIDVLEKAKEKLYPETMSARLPTESELFANIRRLALTVADHVQRIVKLYTNSRTLVKMPLLDHRHLAQAICDRLFSRCK